jgi:hypothetical protein
VLVTGSWLTVKEQMPDAYPAVLAEPGFTAVTFDFAGFGQSGGDLRQRRVAQPHDRRPHGSSRVPVADVGADRRAGNVGRALYLRCGLT